MAAEDPTIGVGIIGATGYIAAAYRAEIRHAGQARIVALCARRRDLLERAAREDDASLVTAAWREVVEHPDVDLVIVATPDALHHDAVMACAAANKHLLCEKPVAARAGEALAMWEAYRSKPGLAHFVPFWTRYLDMFAQARARVGEGLIGDVRSVIYRWFNPRPFNTPLTWRDDPQRSSAGSIADVGSHSYDTICWIIGQKAVRVLTHGAIIAPARQDLGEINLTEALERSDASIAAPRRKGGTFDYANIAWEFGNGATGALLVSHAPHLRKGLAPELELHGTEGSLSVDRRTGCITLVQADRPPQVLETHPEAFANRFAKHVFPAVLSVMAGEASDHPNLEDGYRVQLFTDAAAASARLGEWCEVGT